MQSVYFVNQERFIFGGNKNDTERVENYLYEVVKIFKL